jgi:ATP-dependent helicase YprA (DUF1998 family)
MTSLVHNEGCTNECLSCARTEAAAQSHYDSQKVQEELSQAMQEHCGKAPYPWQLDAAEALILGLDSVVIAGTGAGKTMPFVMPLFWNKDKCIIIISPLKALQRDQVIPSMPDGLHKLIHELVTKIP